MEPLPTQSPRRWSNALGWMLLVGSAAGLAWTLIAPATTWPSTDRRTVSLLVWVALVLGALGGVLGDRSPRWRWALLIASGVVLIAIFVLLGRIRGA